MRSSLVEPLLDNNACVPDSSAQDLVQCLTFLRDAHDDDIISIGTRDTLRSEVFDRLVARYAEELSTDEALARLRELYEEDLISMRHRDAAREGILNAE